jgi:hypothetical protein
MGPTTGPELDRSSEASEGQPSEMEIESGAEVAWNEEETGLDIPKAEYDELADISLPKKQKTTWLPIAAAVGLISGLGTSATALNLQEKKMQMIPKTEEMTELSIPQKINIAQPKPELKSVVRSKTSIAKSVDLTRPNWLGFREPESSVRGKLALPAVSAISVASALGALSHIAKTTELPKNVIYNVIPPVKNGLEAGDTPIVIQKRMATVDANLPVSTKSAIDNMNRVAARSRDSLYVDVVKPKKPVAKTREFTKPQRKEIKQPKIPGVQRSIMIDKSAAGALDILTKTAATTSTTAAEIQTVSKLRLPESRADEEMVGDIPPRIRATISKDKTKTPVLAKGFKTEEEAKPDLPLPGPSETAELDFESEATLEPSAVGITAEALNILNLIALSSGHRAGEKQLVISKSDIRPQDVNTLETTRRPEEGFTHKKLGLTTPRKPEDKRKFKSRDLTEKTEPIMEPKVKRLPGISEAIGLMRPPEKRLALVLNRPTTTSSTEYSLAGRGTGVRATETTAATRAKTSELSKAGRGLEKQVQTERPSMQRTTDDMGKALIDMALSKPSASEDLGKDRMLELEQQVQLLKDRIRSEVDDQQPYHRKLQEVIHDPNLQTQLKKLFYEAWLENLDKELKRYGE